MARLWQAWPMHTWPKYTPPHAAIQNNVQTNTYDPDGPERHRRFYLAVLIGRDLRPVNPDDKHAALGR